MFKFIDKGWSMFTTGKMQREDINKDQQGKGTIQRFLESYFKELDDYSIEHLEHIQERVLDPSTCDFKYIKHFESWMGITVFPASLVDSIRRKVVTSAHWYYKKKATKIGLESLFNLIKSVVVVIEVHDDNSFDSPVTFDDVKRTFDRGRCFGCSDYSLDITLVTLVTTTIDYLLGCYSIIKFNHPIGAILTSATIASIEIVDLMMAEYVFFYGGTASDILDNDGYYKFTQTGNIIQSTRLEGNLVVRNGILKLNL